jgi:hypothetical protein
MPSHIQSGSTRLIIGGLSPKWPDFAWPCVLICALFAGIILAAKTSQSTYANAIRTIQATLAWRPSKAKPIQQPALVIVANPDRQMQVIATLSPRGFESHPVQDADQVRRVLASSAALPRLVVVDAAVGDAKTIIRLLKERLPAGRIVILQRATPREAIGQMLLDRL